MIQSLYEQFGAVVEDPKPSPGTYETNQIETTDNDQTTALSMAFSTSGETPYHGTRHTATRETVDNDVAAEFHHTLLNSDPPRSTLTKAIETTDEDAAGFLAALS